MTPAVTVIVPVYNVSLYIEKCARSLFEQTLVNLEIIFVDDCSPDNSTEIIKEILMNYPNRQAQTRIIKMSTNGGVAAVRRQGIIEATGDYIIYCDGDDWVDLDLYETLYNEAIKTDADIVVCDEVMEYHGYQILKPTPPLPTNGKELLRNWYKCTVGMFCHNKLARRSLYMDNDILPWKGLNMWEDNGLFVRLFYFADTITQIHGGPLYHYNRANINAMTSGYGIKQVEQMLRIAGNLAEFFESRPDSRDYEKTVYALKYLARINLITNSFSNYKRYKQTYPESRTIVSELDCGAFSRKGKFRFYMVRNGFAPIFIIMFKCRNLLKKVRLTCNL